MQVGSRGPLPTGEGGVSVCVLSLIACTLYQGGTEAGAGDSLALTRTDTGWFRWYRVIQGDSPELMRINGQPPPWEHPPPPQGIVIIAVEASVLGSIVFANVVKEGI